MVADIIILFLVDTLRYDIISTLNNEIKNCDTNGKLAIFKGIAPAPYTWASVPSILSSVCPLSLSYGNMKERHSLVELLKLFGYNTLCISSNPVISKLNKCDKGFDLFVETFNVQQSVAFQKVSNIAKKLFLEPFFLSAVFVLQGDNIYASTVSIIRDLVNILNRLLKSNAKVFILLHLMDLHHPWQRYSNIDLLEIALGRISYPLVQRKIIQSDRLCRVIRNIYFKTGNAILSLILHFIRLLDKALGDSMKYIVVIAGDHGEQLCDEDRIVGHTGNSFLNYSLITLPMEAILTPVIVFSNVSLFKIKNNGYYISLMDILPSIIYAIDARSYEYLIKNDLIVGRSIFERLRSRRYFVVSESKILITPKGEYGDQFMVLEIDNGKIINETLHIPKMYEGRKGSNNRKDFEESLSCAKELCTFFINHYNVFHSKRFKIMYKIRWMKLLKGSIYGD